jgi:hypothetical protein
MRTYRCQDCPPGTPDHPAGPRGPLPDRCPTHRADRERRRGRRRRSGLSVVPDDAPATPAAAAPEPDIAPPPPSLADVVRADLDALLTKHPARDTLVALAERLALAADSPLTQLDPRALPPLVRELRATVRDLVDHEEAGDDDLFGDDDLPTAMVDAAAGEPADVGGPAG